MEFKTEIVTKNLPNQKTNEKIDWNKSSPRPIPNIKNYYGLKLPKVGTKEWKSLYPKENITGPSPHQIWIDKYNSLNLSSLKIPKANLSYKNGLANYPEKTLLDKNGICSYRRSNCLRNNVNDTLNDVWFGKKSTWAINFDDGPLPPSRTLYNYLNLKNQSATHFWIGSNVRDYPDLAIEANKRGDHLAIHTWSHPHLTTLNDLQILGELGWTIQIIYDLTGLIPLYYRPPYGDIDNRIRSIANGVFGLKAIMWNGDSSDWSLNQTYAKGDFIDPPMNNFGINESLNQVYHQIHSSINQDQGVIILEHELSEESVNVFINSFDLVKKEGFKTLNVPECLGDQWYQ
ncbi:hypothetical protein CROQUDRAFT_136384 [Cronartium quercuum f. sp. fusiforme G11]|uniref:chitin deacetylase n=1 Tax=Cronartium quercuum f. sp. fusiforme G11 TaxID=708437 RepID=A0A9P6T6M5_9BASI|nr:hypothetical protein CROQUDRAFT_136384 [Cronartium quercuum f. sp. fusiforme G11]